MLPFIANTDKAWFDYLGGCAEGGRLDEVNFWSPRSVRPMKAMTPGEPVFFRLKKPWHAIAGYGFFAHHTQLGLREAWSFFGTKNGDPDEVAFLRRIGAYRRRSLDEMRREDPPLGCTVLRDARFWPEERWILWGTPQGWARNIVQGKTERDPARAERLLGAITTDVLHAETLEEWVDEFHPVEFDQREIAHTTSIRREGQGTFRTRLLDAYGRRCAITGERTEPVLDAAHIQPYLGPPSNHVQNGLLLTKEFHALFDLGLVGVTPDYEIRVSPTLRDRWKNGRRYYAHDRKRLVNLPEAASSKPSRVALEWHLEHLYQE